MFPNEFPNEKRARRFFTLEPDVATAPPPADPSHPCFPDFHIPSYPTKEEEEEEREFWEKMNQKRYPDINDVKEHYEKCRLERLKEEGGEDRVLYWEKRNQKMFHNEKRARRFFTLEPDVATAPPAAPPADPSIPPAPTNKRWLYNCDAPFFFADPDPLKEICKKALKEYTKDKQEEYILIIPLKARMKNCHGPNSDLDIIFKASSTPSDFHAEYFEAQFTSGFLLGGEIKTYGHLVQRVSKGLGTLFGHKWPIGRYPRSVCYDPEPLYCLPQKTIITDELDRMSNLAITHFNTTQGTNYVYVAPLKAYYWKGGPCQHFDIRFKASLPGQTSDAETLEAKIYFVDQPPCGPWRKSGGRISSVTRGKGSLFTD